ncbi:MAG: hypothetical protein ACFB9N_15540 [Geitlerinemataceae cyanobacterium]
MTLQELQQQALQLPPHERQTLIQTLQNSLPTPPPTPRIPGLLRGTLRDAFFEPLPETELQLWE